MTVLDVSNWDLPTFDPECFARSGVERLIVGCWDYSATAHIVTGARAVGIKVQDLYAYVYFGLPHERREVENALRIARELGGIWRVWVDVEATPPHEAPGMTPERRIAIVRDCVRAIEGAGLRAGIYTGRWYWPSRMGDTTEFSRLPLWHAMYGVNDGRQPPVRRVSFGGWTTAAAHQYTSRYRVCGRERDASYWWVDDYPDSGGDVMADAQDIIRELKQNKSLRDEFIATVVGEAPIHLELDRKKRESWQRVLGLQGTGLSRPQEAAVMQSLLGYLKGLSQRVFGTPDFERGLRALVWRVTPSDEWREVLQALATLQRAVEKLQARADLHHRPPG